MFLKYFKVVAFHQRSSFFVLTQRCLIVIDEDNRLKMHDLIRDMEREIVRQESLKDPWKRSGLWFHKVFIMF